ncbi:MAG TPA: hypothetical protein VFQ19_17895 [Nocardioidaceae bacterium]|jgi:hypothetical protein|nr:hypothetical protein [Nocardioidaceae bacterium]
MNEWIVLVPLLVVAFAALLGLAFDSLRDARRRTPVLLSADAARARATVDYYIHVQDSISG